MSQVVGEDCEVYFDLESNKWGVKWKLEIERLISESDALVALVTPSYFNSRMCIYELQKATESNKKILPLYYRSCKELRSRFKEDGTEAVENKVLNQISLTIREFQMKDFRSLRNEQVTSRKVETLLDELAEDIA